MVAVCALLASFPRAAIAPCALPDLPTCGCYTASCTPVAGPWPLIPGLGNLIGAAELTVGSRSCCIKHGGQAYWQIQRQVAIPAAADALAAENASIQTDKATKPQAWCTETIAFWADRASVPYAWGYYTERHHPSSHVAGCREIREWYQDEEAIGGLSRGRWIWATELDYANFEPGVNGPCPGAYQQICGFDRADTDGNGNAWIDSTGHSQLIDSMVVYRLNTPDGPVQRIDVHMVEGNVGFGGTSIYARIINTRWYRDIIDFTPLGPDSLVLDSSNRKIRGWGINLNADGTVYCDSSRIEDVIIHTIFSHALPLGPENSDSAHVASMVNYYATTGGNVSVTTNSTTVQTGGALPSDTNPWTIPTPPHPMDPVCIDVDLLAEHPTRVRGVTLEWVEAIPRQFEIWWAGQNGQPQMRTVGLPSPPPTVPSGAVLPLTVEFAPAAPDTGHPVRYVRLCVPQSALTQTFQIDGFHYNFFYTDIEDGNGSSPEGDAGDPPPTGVNKDGSPPAALWLHSGTPNPFQTGTSMTFGLPDAGPARLTVYDVRGRRVRVLLNRLVDAGPHTVLWDGRNERGADSPSGIYFVRLEWHDQVRTQKLVLTR